LKGLRRAVDRENATEKVSSAAVASDCIYC